MEIGYQRKENVSRFFFFFFEDLIGPIKRFMNWAASHLTSGGQGLYKMEGFIGRRRMG